MKITIIADDFTGALDTATQFSKIGIPTVAYPSAKKESLSVDNGTSVVVVNSESRHLEPSDAYRSVYALTQWALAQGSPIIYKKTDSVLRGNIGSELQAMADAVGGKAPIYFLPGYPRNGRTTVNGIHYYKGMPIAESIFGQDPLEPVICSDVRQVLAAQTGMESRLVRKGDILPDGWEDPCIYICDSQEDADIQDICRRLPPAAPDTPLLLAGCAGFAEYVAKDLLLDVTHSMVEQPLPAPARLLIVSGSLNAVTIEQLRYSKDRGIVSFVMREDIELAPGYVESPDFHRLAEQIQKTLDKKQVVILETAGVHPGDETIPKGKFIDVSESIAILVERILDQKENYAMAVFGGDTLQAIINRLFPSGIVPHGEIEVGVPVAHAVGCDRRNNMIITKSGGFGQQDVIAKIMKYLKIGESM